MREFLVALVMIACAIWLAIELTKPPGEKVEALRIDEQGCMWVYSIEGERVVNVSRALDRAGKQMCGGPYG